MSLSGNTEKLNELISKINALPEETTPSYQEKTVTPSTSAQTVTPDSGYDALSQVTVNAIPSTYVKPSATKSATTYTPSTSNQTIAAGTYCSGAQTIKGDSNLVAGNIKKGTSIFGVTGSYEGEGGGGLQVAEGSFKPTSESNPITVSGMPFTPKIVWIAYYTGSLSANTSYLACAYRQSNGECIIFISGSTYAVQQTNNAFTITCQNGGFTIARTATSKFRKFEYKYIAVG